MEQKRIIKFRGLSADSGKVWCYGFYTEEAGIGYIRNEKGFVIQVDRNTVGQFTGRTDITPSWEDTLRPGSKELYEGDIVAAWVSRYPNIKITGCIEYNDHAQAFQLRYANALGGFANEFLHNYHFFEIKGDIYSTPNLLEK